jgi:hypothetical protein
MPPRGTKRRPSHPGFMGPGLIHSPSTPLRYASTWPRLIAGQQEDNACTSARHMTQGLSPSHPWRHHGTPGMASHSWSTSLQQPSRPHVGPSPLRHRPKVLPTPLPSLDPIKGEARDPLRGQQRTKDENRKTPPHYWDQHPKQCSIILSPWDLGLAPSLTACNLYAST